MPMPPLIQSADDLITDRDVIRDGFLRQALEKTRKAEPYLQKANEFWLALQEADDVSALFDQTEIKRELLSAAGFSYKAKGHLTESELDEALRTVLRTVASKASDRWREEILYRYLLTKGDALGGSMRNWIGAMAGADFSAALLSALRARGIEPEERRSESGERKMQELRWSRRMLFIDKKSGVINNNIDVILLDIEDIEADLNLISSKQRRSALIRPLLTNPRKYIACGELKGGIDPAGADEHWKTGGFALDRIKVGFTDYFPLIFFIGAAIEREMAREIFLRLQDGRLAYAANLTKFEQVNDLANWLIGL